MSRELSISENISNTKNNEIKEFAKEVEEALKQAENIAVKENGQEPRNELEFTELDYRREIDKENFAPQLAKELQLSEKDLEILREKIDNYLKEYSKHVGIISYQGYDMDKNEYYDDWYENGKCNRNNLTKQEFAQSYTMGWIYRWTPYPKDSRNFNGSLFEEVKDAIKLSIQEQLSEGISMKDIDLFKLENNIRNHEYLKPLYDKKQN